MPSTLSAGEPNQAAEEANWAGWRGPQRNAVASLPGPLTWSATDGVRWKTPLPGSGISNPIVWGDRVIVTTATGHRQSDLHVMCLNFDDGRVLWERRLWGSYPTLYHPSKSSMASPSPTTDGKYIYTFFGTGDVICLDMDGGLVWQRALAEEFGEFENRFAASSSPLLHGKLLILQCDHYGESYLVALDRTSGSTVWKADRPHAWLSWSSPQLIAAGERTELVVCGSHQVQAYDADRGELLWTVGGLQRECIPTPLVAHGRLYVVSGPKGACMAIRPGGTGDVSQTHVDWSVTRGAPFVPSSIVVGDLYYQVDDAGILTCLKAVDGSRLWQKRLGGAFTASPIADREKIYFADEAGKVTVIQAGQEEFAELAENTLGEPIYASPALARGRLLLRTAKALYCIENKGTPQN